MTAWSVRPLQAGSGPATAVTIHADDATAREGVYELARAMSVEQFEDLRSRVQHYDRCAAELGHRAAEHCRTDMDAVLDEVCRELGHDLAGVWRVRIGVEEASGFLLSVWGALQQPAVREGGAA